MANIALSNFSVEEGANALDDQDQLVIRPVREFSIICMLGSGLYGTVYKARDPVSNKIFALKNLRIPSTEEYIPQRYAREINNMSSIRHENLMRLYGFAVGEGIDSIHLILEHCPYSLETITDVITMPMLDPPQIKYIMCQLFSGLDYLHHCSIIHRDIHVKNMLFTESGVLKLADYGSSKDLFEGNMTPNLGTLRNRAPELLFGARTYTPAVDMWSSGCVFAELVLYTFLFLDESENRLITSIVRCLGTPTEETWPGHEDLPFFQMFHISDLPSFTLADFFEDHPESSLDLAVNLILYNPEERFTAAECLQHHYFTEEPVACTRADFEDFLWSWNREIGGFFTTS